MNFIGAFVWAGLCVAGIVLGIAADSAVAALIGIGSAVRALQHWTGYT